VEKFQFIFLSFLMKIAILSRYRNLFLKINLFIVFENYTESF